MIQLQVDFALLNKFFGIPMSKVAGEYANKDIEEIMELEASQGNTKAKEYEKILSDPDKVMEIFRLSNVENKFIILQNLAEDDLDKLLPFLEHEQLIKGLYFFTEDKLLAMCQELPMEELCCMIFEKFNMMDVLSFMSEDSMDKFIMEPKVERKYAQNYFESLDDKTLQRIMVEQFGDEFKEKNKDENLDYLKNMGDDDYKRFMTSLQREDKMGLINGVVAQEADLMLLFEPSDMVKPMDMLMKEDKIKLMKNLDPEFLVPMIEELPIDLTQIVLTQIDPRVFSEILTEDFKDILSSVVLFSNKAA